MNKSIYTQKKFLEYLNSNKSTAIIGYPRDPNMCPIFTYFKENNVDVRGVSGSYIRYYDTQKHRRYKTLPGWMSLLIDSIDRQKKSSITFGTVKKMFLKITKEKL